MIKSWSCSERGEIFDPFILQRLCRQMTDSLDAQVVPWKEPGDLTKYLNQKQLPSVALVAYDSGPDYKPVMRKGAASHWCLVLGTFALEQEKDLQTEGLSFMAFHGLSRLPIIGSLSDLFQSNGNLSIKRGFADKNIGYGILDDSSMVPYHYPMSSEEEVDRGNKLSGTFIIISQKK